MTLTEEQRKQFEEKVKPLMKWLADNAHPHVKAIVDSSSAEIVEGVVSVNTDEFIAD